MILLVLSYAIYLNKNVNAGSPGSVIINEIMYNPGSGNQNDEFLELYNTTNGNIDLSGWCFSEGITLITNYSNPSCFELGTSIAPNSYIVVSPDAAQTLATYGVVATAVYSPTNLSNGGERVTLVDESSQVISSVSYDDASPWPTSPDGSGPSLELKNPGLDNAQASSWAASLTNGGTPGQDNSVLGVDLPQLSLISKPSSVNSSDTPFVTVNVENVDTVDLYYRVGFNPEQHLTMFDDGLHSDGLSSDNTYGVSIPPQGSGQLVRYRVVANGSLGSASLPSNDDSMTYQGYVVNDGVASQAPIMRWFVTDEAYADILDNPPEDDSYRECVIEYNGYVYDNTSFRLKGEYSRTFPKKAFKFKLPSGHTINLAGGSEREVTEFHMNSNWADGTSAITPLAWWVAKESGIKVPDISPLRVQRNNQFEGVYIFAEKYEKEWKQEYGYDTGNIYEDFFEKKQGDESDRSDIEDWKSNMSAFSDQAKRDYILDNNDIPNILTFTAFHAILRSHDQTSTTNTFAYHDTEGTGRWSIWPWDLDLLFNSDPLDQVSPYNIPNYLDVNDRFPTMAIYQQPDLRKMYFRRLRTLVDKFYKNETLKNKYLEEASKYEPDMELDRAKWPGDIVYNDPLFGTYNRLRFDEAYYTRIFNKQRADFLYRYNQSWAVPQSQKEEDEQQVFIEEVGIDAENDGNEYIKISNSSDEYVDISDWTIEGLEYTIPAGTVVPSNGSIFLVKNDVAYRDLHSSVFIAGQYQNSLSVDGPEELMLKSVNNQTVSSYQVVN